MCLIAYLPDSEAQFSTDMFRTAYENNGDGLGIMFPEDGRLQVVKELGKYRNQKRLFRSVQRMGVPFAMHLRWRTHGAVDLANTHPYQILDKNTHGRDLWLMHNGVLGVPEYDKSMSDTWHLIEYYMRPIVEHNPDIIFDSHFKEMIEDFIGSGNKLLAMDDEGRTQIFNKKQGVVREGTWLSNTYSLAKPYKFNYGGYSDWTDEEWNTYRNVKYGSTEPTALVPLKDEEEVEYPGGRKFYDATTGVEGFEKVPVEEPEEEDETDEVTELGLGVSVHDNPELVAEVLSRCTDFDIEQWAYSEMEDSAELLIYLIRNYFFQTSNYKSESIKATA